MICSCPNGYLISDDGKSCHKRTEVCKTNPCLCRGTAGGGGGGAAFGYNQSEFDDAKLSRLLSSGTIDDGGTSGKLVNINKSLPLISMTNNNVDCDEPSGEEVDVKREETGDDAITVNARIFQLEYGVFVIVIIALVPLNIPCKYDLPPSGEIQLCLQHTDAAVCHLDHIWFRKTGKFRFHHTQNVFPVFQLSIKTVHNGFKLM